MHIHSWCLILFLAAPAQTPQTQTPAQPAPAQQQPSKLSAEDLPVDIDRIQHALENTPKLRFDKEKRPVFRVEVFGPKPTIDDILGPDWDKGPVPYAGMSHQEFLNMVTPQDVQGNAAFSNREGAVVAASSLLFQWTLQKAIAKYRASKDDREREAARKEVLEALQALEDARAKAGRK